MSFAPQEPLPELGFRVFVEVHESLNAQNLVKKRGVDRSFLFWFNAVMHLQQFLGFSKGHKPPTIGNSLVCFVFFISRVRPPCHLHARPSVSPARAAPRSSWRPAADRRTWCDASFSASGGWRLVGSGPMKPPNGLEGTWPKHEAEECTKRMQQNGLGLKRMHMV